MTSKILNSEDVPMSARVALASHVKHRPNGCLEYTGYRDINGYGVVSFTGTGTSMYAHRLSYILHHGSIQRGLFVCHECDNPSCVNPAHLKAGTQKDNLAGMVDRGRSTFGSRNGRAKLTEVQVAEIKASKALGKDLAKKYGVSPSRISAIRCGHNWSHV